MERTKFPICPHCGAEDREPWDHDWSGPSEEHTHACGKCDGEYLVVEHVSTTYSTRMVPAREKS